MKEIPTPARYAGETSSLSIPRVLRQFPGRLLWSLMRRLVLKNFVYDFNLASLHLAVGVPLLLTGVGFGAWNWFWYSFQLRMAAPTGTVVLPALLIMVGVQLLLSAARFDLEAVPREPINRGSIAAEETPPPGLQSERRDIETAARTTAGAGEGDRRRGGGRRLE